MASLIIERPYSPTHGNSWRARLRPVKQGVACYLRDDAGMISFAVWPTLAACIEWLDDDCTA
jgi:hypothetical protein